MIRPFRQCDNEATHDAHVWDLEGLEESFEIGEPGEYHIKEPDAHYRCPGRQEETP